MTPEQREKIIEFLRGQREPVTIVEITSGLPDVPTTHIVGLLSTLRKEGVVDKTYVPTGNGGGRKRLFALV